MPHIINIRRGYDIKLKGLAAKSIAALPVSDVVAIKPSDFQKVKPKLQVSPGDMIQAGQCLFTDKNRPELRFTSPVSGEIAEIVIGEKRRILEILILPDKTNVHYLEFAKANPSTLSRDIIIQRLLESGCWNYIRQRPYSLIADPAATPKAIFISCFDSAPLAPDISFVIEQESENFAAGIRAMSVLSDKKLHIGLRVGADNTRLNSLFPEVPEDHIHYFKGPHPAGNVGIQIHHIDPIQRGETVWYIHPQDVIIIGRLFNEGRYRADRLIAVTGSCVAHPQYLRTITGQQLKAMLPEESDFSEGRIIQGNVLHGIKSAMADFLSFYTNQITVIPEGNQPEFLGWLLPGFGKLSLSKTYFSWLTPKKEYALNTNLNGEPRAFVMTGEYDKVLPMDIYPVFLLKAILAKDIEKMEALGIYEVAEEDFALCEFVCTSKIEVQKIIRDGLELMKEEA